ncbi:MAG: hypothetical protein FWD70_00455 [Desulfuromonadales bacterium]|nr:hypothetical protein [Desulfuromonadales bacterium]
MNSYRVVLAGKLVEGSGAETAITQFMQLTNTNRPEAENLLTSGKPTVIKKNIDKETGERYINTLTNIGIVVELIDEPESEGTLPIDNSGNQPPAYTPPTGNLTQKPVLEPLPAEFRVVPAGNAMQWLRSAYKMFSEEPWRWPFIYIIYMAIILVLALVPFLGSLVVQLSGPIFIGAIMIAASTQKDGLKVGNLFLVFQQRWQELILLAIFGIVATLITLIPMIIPFGMMFTKLIAIGNSFNPNNQKEVADAMLGIILANPVTVVISFLIYFIILALWLMAYYFAPALITLRNRGAWESICMSFKATLKNWKPFLVAGIVIPLLLIVAIVIISAIITGIIVGIAFATKATHSDGSTVIVLSTILGIILCFVLMIPLMSILTLFQYTSFEDIFYIEEKEEVAAENDTPIIA